MRKTNYFLGAVLVITICLSVNGHCQCKCDKPPKPLSTDEVDKYKGNYVANYRGNLNPVINNKHSISVDFSRQSILAFYQKVFVDDLKKDYRGINIHFACLVDRMLPRQKDKDQIGLIISATDKNCKSDSTEYNIINNSFDQSEKEHDATPRPESCDPAQFHMYTMSYKKAFADNDSSHYTRHVHFDKAFIEGLKELLIDNPSYAGIRFDFGSYDERDVACGQISDTQIVLLVTPTFNDGTADYPLHSAKELKMRKILETLNHGSLCPSYCQ